MSAVDNYLLNYDPDSVSFYIHIPFCHRKCGYCDFYATVNFNDTLVQDYVDMICKEYQHISLQYLDNFTNFRNPHTIFFGGGTPSILSPSQIAQIINTIDPNHRATEITLESNPDDLDVKYIEGIIESGINRLSIGVQSFDVDVLKTLNRTHSQENVIKAVETAKNANLPFSLDLIYGAPNECLNSWQRTIETAVNLEPNHLSLYALTLSKYVPLYHKVRQNQLPQVDSDSQADKYQIADKILQESGYEWVEISNYAKINKNSNNAIENLPQHNLQYWLGGNYFGLGCAAHSYIHYNNKHIRYSNTANIRKYFLHYNENLTDDDYLEFDILTLKSVILEKTMLLSRLNIDLAKNLHINSQNLTKLNKNGLIDNNYYPTLKGRLLGDELIRQITDFKTCERYQTSRCMSCPQCIVQ